MKKNEICPVCGYELDEPPYDEYDYPSYNICSCCGFEYGVTDDDLKYTFESYRKEWENKGYPFRWEKEKPQNWGVIAAKKQLENLKLL
jgi:hypothetical protein